MALEKLKQRFAKVRAARNQARNQWIAAVALQRTVFERADKPSGAGHQRDARSYVPFIFRNQRESDVDQTS